MMVVGDPDMAAFVSARGVDRLFVDLEVHGKAQRQGHVDSWKSHHTPETISAIRAAAPQADLLVRVNPLHDGSSAEVEDALARGASTIMLPMFQDAISVARFADILAGRARFVPLVETVGALAAVEQILALGVVDELYFGLNDLHLDQGRRFMFQPLADGDLDPAAAACRRAGIPFGIGGVGRAGEGAVTPELILGEHVRLGSTWAILSRSFHARSTSVAQIEAQMDFAAEARRLKDIYAEHLGSDQATLAANTTAFRDTVAQIVAGQA